MNGMNAEQVILSRGLPKTGQRTDFAAGDDGDVEAGWWQGRKNDDNKPRFIVKTLDGDDVVIDLATGLMWAANGNEKGCKYGDNPSWPLACVWGVALDFAGFRDWRLPNVFELLSITDCSLKTPCIKQPPFVNTLSTDYWSSTTNLTDTTNALYVSFADNEMYRADKTDGKRLRCVRGGI